MSIIKSCCSSFVTLIDYYDDEKNGCWYYDDTEEVIGNKNKRGVEGVAECIKMENEKKKEKNMYYDLLMMCYLIITSSS